MWIYEYISSPLCPHDVISWAKGTLNWLLLQRAPTAAPMWTQDPRLPLMNFKFVKRLSSASKPCKELKKGALNEAEH
jgi:hypothetical protein